MVRTTLASLFAVLLLCGAPAPSRAQSYPSHQHGFGGAEHWAKVFDDPARDAWQKPHEVIQALGLSPDSVVADIGSGTGYFSARLAHFVPRGRVYGVDTEPDMVKYLAERAKREGLGNLVSLAGAPDDPRLPVKADLILMVDVFHHIADRGKYLRNLKNSLKPGGRIAIIDFNEKSAMGPPASERVSAERVTSEFNKAGFALLKRLTFLPDQYFLIFQPAAK